MRGKFFSIKQVVLVILTNVTCLKKKITSSLGWAIFPSLKQNKPYAEKTCQVI